MVFFPSTSQKLVSLVLVIFTTWFLLVNSEKSVSFNINNFNYNKPDIILRGSAKISDYGYLALTDPNDSTLLVGHALYSKPVPIWDGPSGNVARFVTSFYFDVENVGDSKPADGFVFFLAPDSEIPNNSSGGHLGIVDRNKDLNNFVGVELDNYVNSWDPKYSHIGINFNSLMSLKTVPWNRADKALSHVTITYDSISKTLTVVLADQNGQFTTLGQVLDLKEMLPETVRIGFSASTSRASRQLHNIRSWYFGSVLKTDNNSTTNSIASDA
ncbi:putative bark agglutinin LECRPA3 [Vicia villosa]|uniref:putative bark agglutinin LECRPA3 n=1 Tax=Vicia villosa TaxID=3911 RepID=UPI00273A952E|nr:putative bark agglutinin LECRPA3 [Vicia villosa]